MKIASHLMVSRHGVYYLRYIIPKSLRAYFNGRSEIKKSLITRDPKAALFLSKQIGNRIEQIFYYLLQHGRYENHMKSKLDFMPSYFVSIPLKDGSAISIKTDPNSATDHKNAMEMVTTVIKESALRATPDLFASLPTEIANITSDRTIIEVVEKYSESHREKWKEKTFDDYKSILNRFADYAKSKSINSVNQVTKDFIQDFKLSLVAPSGSKLGARRADFIISVLHGFFNYASHSGYFTQNKIPTENQRTLTRRDKDKLEGYAFFDNEHLQSIFNPLNLNTVKKPHEFWLPIIAIFTGLRINEIAQIYLHDFVEIDGCHALRICDDEPDQSVKSPAARRVIPLHPSLINIGLMDYIEDVKKIPNAKRLFPYLPYRRDGYGALPSKAFARYLKKINAKNGKEVFHSLRKTMNNRLKELGINEETRAQIAGHAHDTVNATIYSQPHQFSYIKSVIYKLTFDGVDFSTLKYEPGLFSKVLADEMQRREREINRANAAAERITRSKGNTI
jgi:integrase